MKEQTEKSDTVPAHTHERCKGCEWTERAWSNCIIALAEERRRVANAYHDLIATRDEILSVYQSLPSRRTKAAKRLLALSCSVPTPTEGSHEE